MRYYKYFEKLIPLIRKSGGETSMIELSIVMKLMNDIISDDALYKKDLLFYNNLWMTKYVVGCGQSSLTKYSALSSLSRTFAYVLSQKDNIFSGNFNSSVSSLWEAVDESYVKKDLIKRADKIYKEVVYLSSCRPDDTPNSLTWMLDVLKKALDNTFNSSPDPVDSVWLYYRYQIEIIKIESTPTTQFSN